MKKTLLILIFLFSGGTGILAQSPQFSQFYSNPIYTNPAFAGDAGTPRFIANYRNQWASVGTPFQTAAFSFDTYAEDAGIGFGMQALHDQRGSALKSDQLSAQVSKLVFLDGQKEYRLIGGLQGAWTSNRWNGDDLSYVSQFLGSSDPMAAVGITTNRVTASAGVLLEYVPKSDYDATYWISSAWHNIGVNEDISIEHQNVNFQVGTKIPIEIPSFFGNNLGRDLERESAVTLAMQVRKQGTSRQLDAGFNIITSPLLFGVWYRGMIFGPTRRDALIGTVGWAMGNVMLQTSYDLPVSSLGQDTGSFEVSVWYGIDALFRFTGKGSHDRRSRKCLRY
ncbi:PorP/SprF family type IX secretion system membrane protein [Dyadobacter psychrotolerans]|uniref:Type IX secretion system membrane protein PorP/SprF n=1 Tax=Dyadobacter psychrotolerans TaxID=2541721 RepID=A0A4V6PFQ0_9BACT|nr:PorP/SprF family type IX secretion system membrane protein [Dyadobacter psychrotolerans]TDE12008.1 type IX secretion system membrane protein PorP/SprF [Dyadobacter psychrotolerans]